jgi:hypothetical protein
MNKQRRSKIFNHRRTSNLSCAIIFVERVLQSAIYFLHQDCILLDAYDEVIFNPTKKIFRISINNAFQNVS